MAFTGTPVIQKVTDGLCRVTGVSLASGSAGTIGFAGGSGEVDLPADPTDTWTPFDGVTLVEAVQIYMNPVTDVSNYGIPIRVVKTGSTNNTFLATLTNDSAATASADLEIYVRFH